MFMVMFFIAGVNCCINTPNLSKIIFSEKGISKVSFGLSSNGKIWVKYLALYDLIRVKIRIAHT